MPSDSQKLEHTMIAKTDLLQLGWGALLLVLLAQQLIHEMDEAAMNLPNGLVRFPGDIVSIVAYLLLWFTGFSLLKYGSRYLRKQVNQSEQLFESYQASDARYRHLSSQMNLGFALHEIILDQAGLPCDYRFLEVNPAYEAMTGLLAVDVVGKTVLQVLPGTEDVWIQRYGRVALKGTPDHFEQYSRELDCWYEVTSYCPAPGQFVVLVQDVTERDKLAECLREYQYVIETSRDMIISLDEKHRYLMANRAFLEKRGVTLDEVIGKTPEDLLGVNVYEATIKPNLERAFRGETVQFVLDYIDEEQDERHLQVTYQPMLKEDGTVKRVFGFVADITERLQLEEQLLQSQKMESIGTLAGGVAHDFNNILTVILASGDFLQTEFAHHEEIQPFVSQILSAGGRAAGLTQSLLAFSRKQAMQVEQFDANDIIDTIYNFLGRIIGENLLIELDVSTESLTVCADRGKIEQVLMNLVINARDAMPDGGSIQISTRSIESNAAGVGLDGLKPGRYALLAVKDTGCGMSEKIVSRIFEPFFTTKEVGRGTGLGLSVAYGIMCQHNGALRVDSVPGAGSCFKVYLPLVTKGVPSFDTAAVDEVAGGHETILLIEDDEDVRFMSALILKNCGYQVLEASNSEKALAILRNKGNEIALVISDIMMPGMNGKQFAEIINLMLPDLPVLLMTGYATETLGNKGIITEHLNLMMKPLDFSLLRSTVRELIDVANKNHD